MSKRQTKIVATIGPASQDEPTLRRLIQVGVNVARLNFSHGEHNEHAKLIQRIRKLSNELGKPVTVLQDLQGPKIRTGDLTGESVILHENQKLVLTTEPIYGSAQRISVDLPELPVLVQPGDRILLDDGNLELKVTDISGKEVFTQIITGGILKPHKGVNLPGVKLPVEGFTTKDREDLAFGLAQGVDAVAVSFVRTVKDILAVRNAIEHAKTGYGHVPIIAKLERPETLENLHEIVTAADGVMVARGDLGVEMTPQVVPIAQKEIIATANRHAKVVITATQMLDSMITHPRPTRAEASDVANAIFDGSDAVMLSGETAVGSYPIQSVEMMDAIICQAERHLEEWGHYQGVTTLSESHDDTYFITLAARELAHDRNVAAIAVFTKSGRTALLMSKARPEIPVLAFTPDQHTYNRLAMYWGVSAYHVPHAETIEVMLEVVENAMLAGGVVETGQQVVVICGFPVKEVRPTNMALLYTVGSRTTQAI